MASFCSDHAEVHLLAREEAARSAEKSSVKADASDATDTGTKSTCAMSTESSAVDIEEEDKQAADILISAAHQSEHPKMQSADSAMRSSVASVKPLGTKQDRPNFHSPDQRSLHPGSTVRPGPPPQSAASQAVSPSARGATSGGPEIKPPMLPGSTGTRTQRPRPVAPRPSAVQPDPQSMQPAKRTSIDGSAAPAQQVRLPKTQLQTVPTPAGIYTMPGVPPAPVRSKRTSLADASQNIKKMRAPSAPTALPLSSPTIPLPQTFPGGMLVKPVIGGQQDSVRQERRAGDTPAVFPPPLAAVDRPGVAAGGTSGTPGNPLMAARIRHDVGSRQQIIPVNQPIRTAAPGPSPQ